MCHLVERSGKAKRTSSFGCNPPSQETYLRYKRLPFLRRTERMRFILTPIRSAVPRMIPLSLAVCRRTLEDKLNEHRNQTRRPAVRPGWPVASAFPNHRCESKLRYRR